MITQQSEENNVVTLSGVVVTEPVLDHILYGEEFYTFCISIPRLSGAADVLPLTVSDRLMLGRKPDIGDHVTMRGQLRSYNKQVDGSSRLIITAFAKMFKFEDEYKEFINDICITGYICKPVIYRTTPFMREIADILVAVNRQYGKSDYLPCIAWGRNARFAGDLPVGERIRMEGRIQSRRYQKTIGDTTVERTAYEISSSMIELASKHEQFSSEGIPMQHSQEHGGYMYNERVPYQAQNFSSHMFNTEGANPTGSFDPTNRPDATDAFNRADGFDPTSRPDATDAFNRADGFGIRQHLRNDEDNTPDDLKATTFRFDDDNI